MTYNTCSLTERYELERWQAHADGEIKLYGSSLRSRIHLPMTTKIGPQIFIDPGMTSFAPASGFHYNPAVTDGFLIPLSHLVILR